MVSIFIPNLESGLVNFQIAAIGVAILSVCFHSLGSVLVKRCGTDLPALHVVVGALWVSVMGQFILAPTTLFNWPDLQQTEVYAILYAATVGSVIGFMLYFYLIRQVDRFNTRYYTSICFAVWSLFEWRSIEFNNLVWNRPCYYRPGSF